MYGAWVPGGVSPLPCLPLEALRRVPLLAAPPPGPGLPQAPWCWGWGAPGRGRAAGLPLPQPVPLSPAPGGCDRRGHMAPWRRFPVPFEHSFRILGHSAVSTACFPRIPSSLSHWGLCLRETDLPQGSLQRKGCVGMDRDCLWLGREKTERRGDEREWRKEEEEKERRKETKRRGREEKKADRSEKRVRKRGCREKRGDKGRREEGPIRKKRCWGDQMGSPCSATSLPGLWALWGSMLCAAHLYWGGERRGGLLLPLLGRGSPGAPTSSWLRGRRLLAEPGFSMPGLLRRGKLLSARAAWRAQSQSCQGGCTQSGVVPSPPLQSLLCDLCRCWPQGPIFLGTTPHPPAAAPPAQTQPSGKPQPLPRPGF